MTQKNIINLADGDATTEKFVLGRYKVTSNETVVNIVWSGGTGILNGTVEICVYFDGENSNNYNVLDTITLSSASGREYRYFDIDIDAIELVNKKNDMTACNLEEYIKMSEK